MQEIPRETVERAKKGDLEAFETIYKQACGFVFAVALRYAHSRADAEEITQDVFMRIFRNIKSFEFRSSLKTWVYRITVNTAINEYKRVSREKLRRQEYEKEAARLIMTGKADHPLDKEGALARADELLKTLGPNERACILLREMEGLSYKEISEVLRTNINTVRTWLRRARQAFLNNSGIRG